MRIIGGKDFYDAALSHGFDESVVFVRSKEDIREKNDVPYFRLGDISRYGFIDSKGRSLHTTYINRLGVGININRHAFIVAGKNYPMLEVHIDSPKNLLASKTTYCWSRATFIKLLAEQDLHEVTEPKNKYQKRGSEDFVDIFDCIDIPAYMRDWMIINKITIMHTVYEAINKYDNYKWAINPTDLNQYEMVKAVDPFTLNQEIAMWVGGVLASAGRPMVELTDKDRIHKAGFDNKTSFRKSKVS